MYCPFPWNEWSCSGMTIRLKGLFAFMSGIGLSNESLACKKTRIRQPVLKETQITKTFPMIYIEPKINLIVPRPLGTHIHGGKVYHSLHLNKVTSPIYKNRTIFIPYH